MHSKLIIEQKLTAFTNKYDVYATNDAGVKSQLQAFAQQKRLTFREKVTFYSNEDKAQIVFSFRAEKTLDVHGRYIVEDPAGNVIGMFKKEFAKSLLNSTWNILDAKGEPKIRISESNQALALLRRFGGMIPIIGEIIEIITTFFRYHFVFRNISTDQIVGTYQKITLFRDHYCFSMADEAYDQEDWRVLASVAVALDALQSR